jgi:hypothetical protein
MVYFHTCRNRGEHVYADYRGNTDVNMDKPGVCTDAKQYSVGYLMGNIYLSMEQSHSVLANKIRRSRKHYRCKYEQI